MDFNLDGHSIIVSLLIVILVPPTDIIGSSVVDADGSGRALIQIGGARRANSFDYYKKVIGIDPAPVKLLNTPGKQYTAENLPIGATVEITITGVNAAGEGQPSEPVSVVVA